MTTAMAEVFDTQMADSGEVDMSMYTTMATTDSWLSVEAQMTDEGFEYAQEGIEVEMGDDDEPITEYEMADEGDNYELQDVEVYDISQAPSPLVVDDHLTTNPSPEGTEIMLIPSDDHSSDPVLTATPEIAISDIYSAEVSHPVELLHPHIMVHDIDAAYEPHAELTVAVESTTVAPSLTDGCSDVAAAAVASTGLHETTHEPVALATPELRDVVDQQVVDPIPEHSPDLRSSFEFSHLAGGEPEHTAVDILQSAIEGCAASPDSGTADPHEISEGVCIDPPPAVLLSLPPSFEYGECSLFNLPTSSVPQSPSSSVKADTGNDLHLLLHDRPTLYYEPLSVVFAALRQEEFVQNMPDRAEVELILDAYDLQLSISEDNVYTHEVTLHELNVIHDDSDLGGPLRLRLKVFSPRFVTRYTTLRDQIARLNMTGNGDAHTDAPAAVEQQLEQEEPHTQHEDPTANDYQAGEGEAAPVSEEHHTTDTVSEHVKHNHTDVEDSTDQFAENATVSSVFQETAHEPVQQQAEADASAHSAESYDEDGEGELEEQIGEGERTTEDGGVVDEHQTTLDDAEANEAEETLDADEVHDHAAVEEGGDYVEHDEFPDDEDEFGDDLPEELGGDAPDEDSSHTGPTDVDPVEETPYVEGEFEYAHEELAGTAGVGDEDKRENSGLTPKAGTDTVEHSNSIEVVPEGDHDSNTSTTFTTQDHDAAEYQDNDNTHEVSQYHAILAGDDDLDDNWDDDEEQDLERASPENDRTEALSRKSSTTTLASRTSKRAYEEADLDDLEDDGEFAPSSPGAKRPRVE
ncbi:hypothetical protein C8Q80DRAFT_1353850 [Daedaleopsis nitida]|nr:hypothetical protein C8Q80DRAFT_1353850 [Daedaleopsis nitida]